MTHHTFQLVNQERNLGQISRFFGRLSPPLFQQALNLRNTITSLDSSRTGSWQDILTAEGAEYWTASGWSVLPWLTGHCWLLDGWQYPTGPERERLEGPLFLAMFFTYVGSWLNEAMLDPDTIFDANYAQLRDVLYEEVRRNLEELLPATSPYWEAYNSIISSYREAATWEQEWQLGTGTAFQTADWQRYTDRLAPIKIGISAAVYLMNRPEDLSDLWEMIDFANQAVRIRQEIIALRRDIGRGHLTYPIMRTLALAGREVARPFQPEQIMGAAILTGSIKKVCAEAAERLAQSRQKAADMALPGWLAYCDEVEASLADIQGLFSLKAGAGQPPNLSFLPYRDVMGQSLQMAAGYLLADPTFGESVEVNRGGLEGLDKATGVIFPYSFITYLLLENGHPLAGHVDDIFERMDRLGYRYYENMAVAPDTDETAILLRLFKYSQNQDQHRRQLERPLGWLANNLMPDGRIPAFWDKVDVPVLARMVVWENYCMTAEINTLLGLIDYDWSRFQPLIEKSAVGLFGRYLETDFGTVAYYGLLYTIWQAMVLARRIEVQIIEPSVKQIICDAREKLSQRLAFEVEQVHDTPQQAAFLALACVDSQN